MIIRAELKCKQTGCEADPCAVDKVIELPSPRFRLFSRALLADYDFIAENKNAIRHDEDARHCLLILDAEGKDGFLVDPQGYNYARYSAFVPNARSLLTPDMGIDRSYLSPAEPWRDESRDEMLRMTLRVDGKPDYTLVLPADEDYLDAVKNYLDILLLPGDPTVAELLKTISLISAIAPQLISRLAERSQMAMEAGMTETACGACEHEPHCSGLEIPPCQLAEAGISPNTALESFVEEGRVIVQAAEKTAADVLIDDLDDDVRTMLEDSGVRMEGVCRLLEKEEISE